MTVYFDKARGKWLYDFWRRGVRYRAYCKDASGNCATSKRTAEEAEKVEQHKVALAPKLPTAAGLTLATVVADLTPLWKREANWTNKRVYLREIVAHFGADRTVGSISEADIDDYIAFALSRPILIWTGGASRDRAEPNYQRYWKPAGRSRSAATVNRYLAVLRALFKRAHKVRDPITNERAIAELPEIVDLSEPKRKARPMPDGVFTSVIGMLPQHVREAAIASLLFGFRRSEIYRLKITDLDFELGGVWLSHDEVKDDEDSFLPGSPDAMAFMRGLVDQARARDMTRVISWRRPRTNPHDQEAEPWREVESPKRAWKTAMKKILIAFGRKYRWHDIRAAYISHVAVTSGGPAAKRLARHSDYRTTEGYILVEDDILRRAAEGASARPALALLKGGKSPQPQSPTAENDAQQKRTKVLK